MDLNILYVEDDDGDAKLVRRFLAAGGIEGRLERVDNRAGFVSALERGGWDLVLADSKLPGFDGEEALKLTKQHDTTLPFIFVTGAMGEELAVETLKKGATDYVLKDRLSRLVSAVQRAMQEKSERQARQRAEAERQQWEAKLMQLQKFESLAVLAGGVAHDFNNLLTGILGFAELTMADVAPESPARENLQQIIASAMRAAELTRQMLAYSGRGRFVVKPLCLSSLVREMEQLLAVSVSRKASLTFHLAADLPQIKVDGAQIRQAIISLVTNASEALNDQMGGITISTGSTWCDAGYFEQSIVYENLPEGRYVYLDVTDTGGGMSPEIQARIFDPFFTTKFTGRGLGLPAVLGIVRGHHGAIVLYSEPGHGSTFKLLFPAMDAIKNTSEIKEIVSPWRGTGLVLVVDDEAAVRSVAKAVLEKVGFTVLMAANGLEGVSLFRRRAGEISLVLLDLTMPQMDGEQAFHEIRRIRPDARVIVISGYNEPEVLPRFGGEPVGFLHKPFRKQELLEAVCRSVAPPKPKDVSASG